MPIESHARVAWHFVLLQRTVALGWCLHGLGDKVYYVVYYVILLFIT